MSDDTSLTSFEADLLSTARVDLHNLRVSLRQVSKAAEEAADAVGPQVLHKAHQLVYGNTLNDLRRKVTEVETLMGILRGGSFALSIKANAILEDSE